MLKSNKSPKIPIIIPPNYLYFLVSERITPSEKYKSSKITPIKPFLELPSARKSPKTTRAIKTIKTAEA